MWSGLFIILVRHLCNVKSDQCGMRQIWFACSSCTIYLLHAYTWSIQNALYSSGRQNSAVLILSLALLKKVFSSWISANKIMFQVKICIQLFTLTFNFAPPLWSLHQSAEAYPVVPSVSDSAHQNWLELETCCLTGLLHPSKGFVWSNWAFPIVQSEVMYVYMEQGQTRALFQSSLILTRKSCFLKC